MAILTGQNFTIVQGYAYSAALDNAQVWSSSAWPSLSGATIACIDLASGNTLGTCAVSGTAPQVVTLALTAAQTAVQPTGDHNYALIAHGGTLGSDNSVLASGIVTVDYQP